MINDFEETGYDLLKSILDYEELFLSDNLLASEYQSIARCRKHIAQIVKFNEERFRNDYSLKEFINNLEKQRKWLSIKEIKEIKNNFIIRENNKKNKSNKNLNINKKNLIIKNKININKDIGSKAFGSDIKLNNKTNRNNFRNNEIITLPLKKNNTSTKDYQINIPINSVAKMKYKNEALNNKSSDSLIIKNN